MLHIYLYRRANGIYIYIYKNKFPKKLQFAAYGQFVLVNISTMIYIQGTNREMATYIQCILLPCIYFVSTFSTSIQYINFISFLM